MTNESDSTNPSADSQKQPSSQSTMTPTTAQESQLPAEHADTPQDNQSQADELAREFRWVEFAQIASNVILAVVGVIALCIYKGQLQAMRESNHAAEQAANAAQRSADTARDALVASERPWVKIKHRIISPLTFNKPAWKGPVASMVIEDTVENVGPTVALNVFSWEDVIPVDSDLSLNAARARQDQWCESNRHPDTKHISGYMLFPKDPLIQHSSVGPPMETVNQAAEANPLLPGKVGFALVGCVCYRSPIDLRDAPLHETKFIYRLGEPSPNGTVQQFIRPIGIADKLQLIGWPEAFSAD